MKNNTMNKYEQKLDGVAASAEVGEDNVVAVITDNRSTTRTTFEQRKGIDQNKLASMVWNIGMDSILNAAKHGMLQVLQDQGAAITSSVQQVMSSNTENFKEDFSQLVNDVFVDGSGTVPEMLDSFTQELTELIQKNVSGSDSDLAKTLEAHIGKESDLMNALDPKSTQGIPHIIQERIQETLSSVLDSTNSSSPIAKLLLNIKEATEEGDLSRTAQIEEITKILDANNTESPIARLLREVNVAVEGSALSILKQSIEDTLQTQNTTIQKIHDMVLETMTAKKTAEGTTLQGVEFEEQVGACLDEIASELNFDNDDVGHTTGVIPNSKKGDFVLCARPDSNTPTLRVVCEAKSDRSYNNVTKAVDESIKCMENRAASSAIFVFNSSRAKDTFPVLKRVGKVVLVQYDYNDSTSMDRLRAAVAIATAIHTEENSTDKAQKEAIASVVGRLENEYKRYEVIAKSAESIIKNGSKITSQVSIAKNKLRTVIDLVNETAQALDVDTTYTDETVELL